MNTHQSFDRESFQSLLANAFSVQQSGMAPDSLAAIIEIQRVVTGAGVDAHYAMNLVAERAQGVADAAGIGIALLEGNQLVHRAGSGTALQNVGSQLTAVLSHAAHDHPRREILRVENAATDSRIEGEICRQFDAEALLMVPIYREHAMKGVLEVFFKEPHIFSEPEVRTYQLMATLAGDASALPVVAAEKRAVSSSTLARALLRMNQQVRQLSVTRQPAPEAPAQERSEPVHAKIISAVRNWDARAYGAQLAASAAKNLGRLRLPKWQLPRLARPRLSWHKTAVDRLNRDLRLLQAQWPTQLRGRLILNVAAVSVVLVLAIMAAIARHQSSISCRRFLCQQHDCGSCSRRGLRLISRSSRHLRSSRAPALATLVRLLPLSSGFGPGKMKWTTLQTMSRFGTSARCPRRKRAASGVSR